MFPHKTDGRLIELGAVGYAAEDVQAYWIIYMLNYIRPVLPWNARRVWSGQSKDDTVFKENFRDELGARAGDVRASHFRGIYD